MNIQEIIARASQAANPQNIQAPAIVPQNTPAPEISPEAMYAVQASQATGAGVASASPIEQDARNLTSLELQQKYGPEAAQQIVMRRAIAQQQVINDRTVPRNNSQAAADTVTDIGMGIANAVGGAAALGAGLVNRDAGIAVSDALGNLNEFAQSTQSPALAANRRLIAAENQMDSRDNKQDMDAAIASGESETSAAIRRVLKDVGSSFMNQVSNPTTLGSLTAQGIGSVLPVGAVTGAVGAVSRAGLIRGVEAGAITAAEANSIINIGSAAGGALTIGAMEAGGAYQQSVEQVMDMSHAQLMKGSEEYVKLVGSGVSAEEAQKIIANKAGLATAGYTAPFAIALGKTVARFEANPLAAVSVSGAARNTLTQTAEEAAQGGTAQAFGNTGIRQFADSSQDISEGVGEQISSGALAGAGMAGVLQVPGVIGNTVAPLAESARTTLSGLAQKRAADAQPEKVVPTTSMPVVAEQAESLAAVASAMTERVNAEIESSSATPEEKAFKSEAFAALTRVFAYSPEHFSSVQQATNNQLDSELGTKLENSTNLVQAIQTVGEHLNTGKKESALSTAMYLDMLLGQAESLASAGEGDSLVTAAQEATADPDSKAFVNSMVQAFENFESSKELADYRAKAAQSLAETQAPMEASQENSGEINARANFAPHTLNHKVVTDYLGMHERGEVTLTPSQLLRLKAAEAITRAMDSLVQNGTVDSDPIALVTREVAINSKKVDDQKYESVTEHHGNVVNALAAGDTKRAVQAMKQLRNLARTFFNKVEAINQNLAAPDKGPVQYSNWARSVGKWLTSERGLSIDPTKERSVFFAKQVNNEASLAVATYNNLREAFPQLAEAAGIVELPVPVLKLKTAAAKAPAKKKQKPVKPAAKPAEVVANKEPVAVTPEPVTEEVTVAEVTPEPIEKEIAVAKEPIAAVEKEVAVVNEAPAEMAKDPAVEEAPEPETVEEISTAKNPIERAKELLKSSNGGENIFSRLFEVKNQGTKLGNLEGEVFPTIMEALGSAKAFQEFSGMDKQPTPEQLKVAFEYFNTYGNYLIESSAAQMMEFLDTKTPGGTGSRLEDLARLMDGTHDNPPELWKEGRGAYTAFLRIERNEDGELVGGVDDYFMQVAGIAAAQWMLTASGRGTHKYTEAATASILGIPESTVTDAHRRLASIGMDPKDIVRGIAEQIERYLGVKVKDTSPLFRSQGLLTALATLPIETMVAPESQGKFFNTFRIHTHKESGKILMTEQRNEDGNVTTKGEIPKSMKPTEYQTTVRYIPLAPVLSEDGVGISTVLDTLLGTQSDNVIYFSPNGIEVSDTQLRSNVGMPKAEQSAQAAQQEVAHKLNPLFAALMRKLSVEDMIALNDAEATSETNENHAMSLEGKAVTLSGSFKQAQFVIGEITAQALATGQDSTDVGVHYKYETTSTGRSMMQGKYNPQSDKLMRNLVMPMKSTLDMNNSLHYDAWNMTAIQMLGVRTYAMLPQDIADKAASIFSQPEVVEAVSVMERVLKDEGVSGEEIVSAMKAAAPFLEDGATNEAMHVLLDRANYNLTKDKSKFETRLYLEADGVANGPAGAIAMLTSDPDPEAFIRNMAKVGLFIGDPTEVMNTFRSFKDDADLYTESGIQTQTAMEAVLENYPKSHNGQMMRAQHVGLLSMLESVFPKGSISFDAETESITIKRKVTKNPLTITVYGSGSKGIASKLVGIIEEELYSKMSAAGVSGTFDENFPVDMFKHMITTAPKVVSNGLTKRTEIVAHNTDKIDLTNFKTFSLTIKQREALTDNVHRFFVKPMVEGITSTVGNSVIDNTKAMTLATGIQAVMLQDAYTTELEKIYKEKEAENPEWDRVLDGLSKSDFKKLEKSLSHLNIRLRTVNQEWEVGEAEKTVQSNATISMSPYGRNKRFGIPAVMAAPGNPGVQVVPYLVIGMGDAAMVQNLFNSEDRPKNILQVFDGINMGVEDISKGGVVVNRSMAEAWLNNNPMRVVAESLAKAVALGNVKSAIEKLSKNQKKSLEEFVSIEAFLDHLNTTADKIDTVHQAIRNLGFAADQMAATEAPYVVEGTIWSIEPDYIAEDLQAEIHRLNKESTPTQEVLVDGIEEVSRLVNSSFVPTGPLKEVGKRAVEALMNTDLAGIKVVRNSALPKGVMGSYDPVTNTIHMAPAAKSETLVHELVHAASIQALHAYAQGGIEANQLRHGVTASIEALENILEDLVDNGWDISRYGDDAKAAYGNMMRTITSSLGIAEDGEYRDVSLSNRMNAVNEMMAWVLTNQPVREMSKLTKFKQALKYSYDFLKRILFGASTVPALDNSVFNQIRFHTFGLMEAQNQITRVGNISRNMAAGTLTHSVGYGNDERIAQIGKTFHTKIGQLLAPRGSVIDQINRELDVKEAIKYAADVTMTSKGVGFISKPQTASAYTKIVTALGTQAKIDPLVLNEAQALYKQAVNGLTVSSFLDNPNETDPAKLKQASDKLNFLLGKSAVFKDAAGRSSLLPNFIALGMVDPDVRKALDSLKIETTKNTSKTFDERLTNTANKALSALQNRLVNGNRNPATVNAALDSLAQTLIDQSNRDQNAISTMATYAQDAIDSMNNTVVNVLADSSKALTRKADKLASNTKSKTVKALANTTSFMAKSLNDSGARANTEGMLRWINKSSNMSDAVASIVKDLTGRTDSNMHVYDMIKIAAHKVSKVRQQFKEYLPKVLQDGFKTAPTESQWTAMYNSFAKIDIGALVQGTNQKTIKYYISDASKLKADIATLEAEIRTEESLEAKRIIAKAKQLANYMVTGIPGASLLRNADAVAHLLGDSASAFAARKVEKAPAFVAKVDKLITMYALEQSPKEEIDSLNELFNSEAEGVQQVISVLATQKARDTARNTPATRFNSLKGFIPSMGQQGMSLVVVNDTELKAMRRKGYIRVADYQGSKIFSGSSMGYYFAPVNGTAPYNQGVFQNARKTSGGVDAATGYVVGYPTAGRITQSATVKRLARNMHLDTAKEALVPVFAPDGTITAFERSIDPAQLDRLEPSTHLAKMLGQWMGRQAEEDLAIGVNQDAVARTYAMWKADPTRQDEYVNVLDSSKITDPVIKDALRLIPRDVRVEAERLFGKGTFMVRRDTLNDLFGYRDASFSDFWSGTSRWSPETQDRVRRALEGVFGQDALTIVMRNEQRVKNLVKDVKTLIVVKSVVVPVVNLIANVFQMMATGVPVQTIATGMRDKTLEIDSYVKSNLRKMELGIELIASEGNVVRTNKIKALIQTIEDSHKRLSIWPLIEAGEFGSITDVGISRDEILLSEGKLTAYIEAKTDKMPAAVKSFGKNFLLTKDTALFQGMQKSMEYGDFIAKAIVYDHYMKKGLTSSQALGIITDEFVNYDRLPGRVRGNLENFGLAWFYNYKLRIAKTAFRMIRQDPVRVALLSALPMDTMELPVTENIFTKAIEGSLGYSLGPGMALDSIGMNPWINAMN